jgi:hypothetical protein
MGASWEVDEGKKASRSDGSGRVKVKLVEGKSDSSNETLSFASKSNAAR